jgi:hypothetical protein
MKISRKDNSVLRKLASRVAEIADHLIHEQIINQWKNLNALKKNRPMVWINEIPWHEMNVNDELTLQCTNEFCCQTEQILRRTIYQWEHLRADMVVEPIFYSPLVLHDTGFGINEKVNHISQDNSSDIISREYHAQIQNEKDLEKIKTPQICFEKETSEKNFQTLVELFGDILSVEKCGIVHRWFAPWDQLISWWGVQNALMDLVLKPDLVHQAMDRLVNAHLTRLDQWEELNLLSQTTGNYRVGSGGLGYTNELPQPDVKPERISSLDQWGCATAQIFSEVSPDMHAEFALQYEKRWLKRFGLNYYGCCEPLHNKIEILKSIPNLRKISVSPWADIEKIMEKTQNEYVLSYKPNPAIFANEVWNPGEARKNLEQVLEKTKGCFIEIIMKDISTVKYEPQRLWEWAQLAMELVEGYE